MLCVTLTSQDQAIAHLSRTGMAASREAFDVVLTRASIDLQYNAEKWDPPPLPACSGS